MAAVVIILVVVLVVALNSEVHVLGLWVFMMITHGFVVESFGAHAVHLPMYAGLIIMAITIGRGKWSGMRTSIWLLILGLVALMALAALTGMDPARSVKRLFAYSKGFILALYIGGVIKDDRQIRIVTMYCLAAAFVGACIAFQQHLTGTYTDDTNFIKRAAGLSSDPNETAVLLLTGVPLALYWVVHSEKPYLKYFFAGVFVLLIGAVTLTQSRGGGVAMFVIMLLLFLRRPSVKVFAIGIVVLCAGFLLASPDYRGRMESLGTVGNSKDTSLDHRFRFVEVGVDVFLKNPLLGVGIGNFGKALVESSSEFDDPNTVAHNMYLEFFVENGVFAGLLFLSLLAAATFHSMRFDKYNQMETSAYGLGFCVSLSLAAVLITGLFLSHGRSSVLWFLVGIGLAFPKAIANSRLMAESRSRPILVDH